MLPRLSPRRKNGFAGEGARALPQVRPPYSKRWISGDDAWVFVTAEGTSICWSVSGRLPLFRQANKLQHEMHYLAPLRQLSRQSIWFSACLRLSPPVPPLCWCALPTGDGQVDFEEFMTILGPKLLSSDNREGFLGNTIDNIFWQVRDKACFSSLTVLSSIYQLHPSRLLSFTLTVCFCSRP